MGIALVLVVAVGIDYLLLHKFIDNNLRRSRHGVLKRIGTPGVTHTVPTSNISGAWNPAAKPNQFDPGLVFGKGLATYWRDEAGLVHLRFQPSVGPEQHFVGVGPALAPRQKLLVRGAVTALLASSLSGFSLGYALSSGSKEDRLTVALLGLLGGGLFLSLLTLVLQVARAVRSAASR